MNNFFYKNYIINKYMKIIIYLFLIIFFIYNYLDCKNIEHFYTTDSEVVRNRLLNFKEIMLNSCQNMVLSEDMELENLGMYYDSNGYLNIDKKVELVKPSFSSVTYAGLSTFDYTTLDLDYDPIPSDYPRNYVISPEIGILYPKSDRIRYYIKISKNIYLDMNFDPETDKSSHFLTLNTNNHYERFKMLLGDDIYICGSNPNFSNSLINIGIRFGDDQNYSLLTKILPNGQPYARSNFHQGFIYNNPICPINEDESQCNYECLSPTDPKVNETKESIFVDLNDRSIENSYDRDTGNFINNNIYENEELITSKFINKLIYRSYEIIGGYKYLNTIASEVFLQRYKLDISILDLIFSKKSDNTNKFMAGGVIDYYYRGTDLFYKTLFGKLFDHNFPNDALFLICEKNNDLPSFRDDYLPFYNGGYQYNSNLFGELNHFKYENYVTGRAPTKTILTVLGTSDKSGTYLRFKDYFCKISNSIVFFDTIPMEEKTVSDMLVESIQPISMNVYNALINLNINYNSLVWNKFDSNFNVISNTNDVISFTYRAPETS